MSPFLMCVIRAKVWKALCSFIWKQSREAECRTLERNEDSIQLFFSVMCNERMILFCSTLNVKALILECYIPTHHHLSILQPTILCSTMASGQASITLSLYISNSTAPHWTGASPFRFIFILLLETLSCWRLPLSL